MTKQRACSRYNSPDCHLLRQFVFQCKVNYSGVSYYIKNFNISVLLRTFMKKQWDFSYMNLNNKHIYGGQFLFVLIYQTAGFLASSFWIMKGCLYTKLYFEHLFVFPSVITETTILVRHTCDVNLSSFHMSLLEWCYCHWVWECGIFTDWPLASCLRFTESLCEEK